MVEEANYSSNKRRQSGKDYALITEITESSGTTVFPYQYVGKKGYYRDEETDDYYVRARSYGPTVARWLSRDPIAFASGSLNLFNYASNDPISRFDLNGMRDCYCQHSDCEKLWPANHEINDTVRRALIPAFEIAYARNPRPVWGRGSRSALFYLRQALGRDMPGTGPAYLTYIEHVLRNEASVHHGKKLGFGFQFSDCVKIDCFGTWKCIGTDKIGHMFQQGHMYFQLWDAGFTIAELAKFGRYTEGMETASSVTGLRRKFAQRMPGGFAGFPGVPFGKFEGRWGGGLFQQASSEDLNANMAGFYFYLRVLNTISRGGKTFKFDICDYVSIGAGVNGPIAPGAFGDDPANKRWVWGEHEEASTLGDLVDPRKDRSCLPCEHDYYYYLY